MVRYVCRHESEVQRAICPSIRNEPSPEFSLTFPCSGIIHQISGVDTCALVQNRGDWSRLNLPSNHSTSAPLFSHKTGRAQASSLHPSECLTRTCPTTVSHNCFGSGHPCQTASDHDGLVGKGRHRGQNGRQHVGRSGIYHESSRTQLKLEVAGSAVVWCGVLCCCVLCCGCCVLSVVVYCVCCICSTTPEKDKQVRSAFGTMAPSEKMEHNVL